MEYTNINTGLSQSEADERAKNGLSNGGGEVRTKSVKRIFFDNIFTLFNLINVILAVALALVGSWKNMLFMGVVLCNTAIGIFQEIRSKRVLDRLSVLSAPKAYVIRDSKEKVIAVSEVVVGDIMKLSSGKQVCADGIVLSGECEADESLLTGESDPIPKKKDCELHSGSFITSGECLAQATRVGAESASGRITAGAKKHKKHNSVMMNSINKIIKTVSICIFPFGIILFCKTFFGAGNTLEESVTTTSAALIGMIPEGLMLLTSIALAVSSIKLAMKQTLCQDLYCAESLARADVLCLDKTGTITEGKMKVEEVVKLDDNFNAEQALRAFSSAFTDKNLTLSAVSESFSGNSGLTLKGTVAFSSARKWSAAEFENYGTRVFGAPSFVLGEKYGEVASLCEKFSDKGMRVLALAFSEKPCEGYNLPSDISAKALVVLSDKIRESAPAALKFFREQGVQLKVISGDDPKTVSGAAGRAGLEGAENYVDMSKVSDAEIPEAALKYTVFGRVLPEQKLALVKALRAAGKTVAMTGDGVNDVPALKEADCSIAIQSGSDAARSVSQLVLMNSEFSTLPLAVAEGRRCINNIERSAALFLVKTILSFLLAAVFLFLHCPYPFKPIQLTLISSIMIGIPSFLLALEPNFNIVRGHFIANVIKKAAPGGVSAAVGICLLEAAGAIFGFTPEHISVMAVFLTAAVCFETLIIVCIPFDLKRALMCGALAAILVGAVLILPGLFYIIPLLPAEWAALGVVAAIALILQPVLSLLIKAVIRRKENVARSSHKAG